MKSAGFHQLKKYLDSDLQIGQFILLFLLRLHIKRLAVSFSITIQLTVVDFFLSLAHSISRTIAVIAVTIPIQRILPGLSSSTRNASRSVTVC